MSIDLNESKDLRTTPVDPETRELVLESRRELLRTLGFSANAIQKLEERTPTLRIKEAITIKIEGLRERGFKDPVKLVSRSPAVLGLAFSNIDEKLAGLKERGFRDPVKLCSALPAILGYSFSNIDEKITGLNERGFEQPVKMMTRQPTVLGLAFSNIDEKLAGLKERGFRDPVKLCSALPAILGYSFSNIDEKLAGLKERGFEDPVKLVNRSPVLLSLAFSNIDEKIAGLRERGFKAPVKMISTQPSVLNLTPSNIDRKLRLLKRLTALFNLNIDPIEAIEYCPALLSYKIDKIWATARVAREKANNIDEITNVSISNLLYTNLETLILAARSETEMGLKKLRKEVKKIKAQKQSKTRKRQLIAALSAGDKLKIRYFRGYPEKKAA